MQFIESLLSENGKISHKRVINLLVALLLLFGWPYCIVKAHDDAARLNLVESLEYFLAAGLSITVARSFAKNGDKTET